MWIMDPNGKKINYAYSPSGDLASVTDRDTNVTSFGYSPSQPHFLTQITDGLGNVVMSGQYNTSGRLTQITNATGASSKLSYNVGSLSESATGQEIRIPPPISTTPRACSRSRPTPTTTSRTIHITACSSLPRRRSFPAART